ncbi:MAG: signal peptidase I [Thermodesulfovibrio sp.]|nr:signal peptidase I [Thermodesulfovibrio sp.]
MNKNCTAEIISVKTLQSEGVKLFEDVLVSGADLRIRVTGRSMKPFLKGGEILTIRRVPCSSLRKGDLILFDCQGSLILHRIIKKCYSEAGTLSFQTQGDARQAADGPVHKDKVLGKVLLIEKPLAGGRTRLLDMASAYWQVLNASIAMTIPIRMLLRYSFRHVPVLQMRKRN